MIGYITSFLHPTDAEKHKKRFDLLVRQVTEWIAKTDIHISIIAMNHTPEELSQVQGISQRVTVNVHPGMFGVFAKNICLTHFYASNEKWCILMDDDAMLYPHNSSYGMIAEMESHIDDYKNIDVFYPHNPMMTGFNGKYKEDKYDTHHIFDKVVFPKGSMIFLRNFAAYNQQTVYFDTEFNMMEDTAFYINLLINGYRGYNCTNLILNEVNHGASYFDEDRKAVTRAAGHRIVDKYGNGLVKKKTGIGIDFSGLLAKNQKPVKVVIPKDGVEDNTFFDWSAL